MQMRFTPSSNYKEMVEAARELGVKWFQVTKPVLAIALNEKLDEIETEQNTVQINLAEAEDALTPTEFAILCQLLLKFDQAKHNMEMDAKMNDVVEELFPGIMKKATIQGSQMPFHVYGDIPSFIHGVPGTGKSENIKQWAEENGIKIIPLNFNNFNKDL
ncbi:hypothetical protein D3C87_573910 [compost metagenome]